MASPETTRRLSSIALFVLPLLAVKLASIVMGGSSPSGASASSSSANDPAPVEGSVVPLQIVEWNASQRAAAEHVRMLAPAGFGPSPMFHTERPAPVIQDEEPVPVETTPEEPAIPEFTLHAVMNTSGSDKALINGRQYQVGQKIEGTNWIVQSIDMNGRSVALSESGTSRTMTISVHRSG